MKNDIVTLERAVKMLPPRCMMVFKLIREDGLKYEEAAQLLKMSPREVQRQMNIAVKKLAQALRNSWMIENSSL